MNVCLLNDSFPPIIDGVANVVMNYAKILTTDLNTSVIVGTPKYPDASYEGYPYKVIPYRSLDTTEIVSGYRTGNPLSMREINQMAEFGPDIIHTHCPASSTIMARILQNETGAPIVFTYHTKFDVDITRAVGEGFLKKETIKAMVSNISACDEVWVVSNGAGENLRSLGYEGDYRVMFNGVDFPKGRVPEDKVRETVSGLDLPENVPVYLYVGRIIKYKGLPIIIDALSRLSDEGVDYRMIFVGGGPDSESLMEEVRNSGISLDVVDDNGKITHTESPSSKPGRVIFTGPEHDREKLRAYNTRADLFLFPSVYDTNGIVVREAAACGLASVLIKGSCAAEGITHDRNGFLIDENAESMAALLSKTASDLAHLHDVGEHAMNEIYISWEDSVRTAHNRYGEIRDMVADGTLVRRKKHSSDYFLESTSNIIKGTEQVFDIPRNIFEGMKENFEDFKDQIEEFHHSSMNEFRENVEDLKDSLDEFRENASDFKLNLGDFRENVEDLKSSFNDFRENIEDFKDDIKDRFSDLSRKDDD